VRETSHKREADEPVGDKTNEEVIRHVLIWLKTENPLRVERIVSPTGMKSVTGHDGNGKEVSWTPKTSGADQTP
jgi:hypothetical protein